MMILWSMSLSKAPRTRCSPLKQIAFLNIHSLERKLRSKELLPLIVIEKREIGKKPMPRGIFYTARQ